MVSWAITGASRGLGKEIDTVIALVRNPNSSSELSKLAAERSNVTIVQGDLNSLSSLQEAAKTVSTITGGELDILINNGAYLDQEAAMLLPSQLTDPENLNVFKDAISKSVESNVVGAVFVTNAFLPLIEQGREKKIVHLTTGLTMTDLIIKSGIASLLPYGASKAMLNAVVARYGSELQAKGIHVVGISPGYVDTNPVPQQALDYMLSAFRKVDPSAERISPETSVKLQLATISKLDWDVQEQAISQHGNQSWF